MAKKISLFACCLALLLGFSILPRQPSIKANATTFSGDTYILSCMPFSVKNGSTSGIVPTLYFRFKPISIDGHTVLAPVYFSQFNAGDNNSNYRYDTWDITYHSTEPSGRYRFNIPSCKRLYYVTTRTDYVGSGVGACVVDSFNLYVFTDDTNFTDITRLTTNVYATDDTILLNFRNSSNVALFTCEIKLITAMNLVDYSATGSSLLFTNVGFDSFESAYEDGRRLGFSEGYERGVDDTIGGNMFGVLANGVDRFLDIHLIGDISIKHLLQVSFGVILLGFFIKIFLGG